MDEPADRFEMEADGIADAVVAAADRVGENPSTPRAVTNMLPGHGRRVSPCREGALPEEIERCAHCRGGTEVQRSATGREPVTAPPARRMHRAPLAGPEPTQVPPLVHSAVAEAGIPLGEATRQWAEASLGYRFRHVRIHTGHLAERSARAVGARAYAVGSQIVFGASQYAPDTRAGRRLLVHELVHTVQQGGAGSTAPFEIGSLRDWLERDAEHIAASVNDPASEIPFKAPSDNQTPVGPLRQVRLAAPRQVVQRQPASPTDINQNYSGEQAIQERLADLEEDEEQVGTALIDAQQRNPSQVEALQAELTVIEREVLMLERLHDAGMKSSEPNASPWIRSEKDVARLIDRAGIAARTEGDALSFLQAEDLLAGRIDKGEVTPTLLQNPNLFRATTLALYRTVTEEMIKRRNEHEAEYKERVAALAAAPIKEVIAEYVRVSKDWSSLERQIRRVHWNVELLRPFSPVALRQRQPGSANVVADQLDVLAGTRNIDTTVRGVAGGLANLRPLVDEWLLTSAYADVAKTMQLFSLSFQTVSAPGVPIAAYTGHLPTDFRWAVSSEAASAKGALSDITRVMRGRLDKWVKGLSWHERITEGFWIYDLGGKVGASVKAMLTPENLILMVGFIAFLVGIQMVPFVNLLVDAILLITTGLDMIKGIFVFGDYFDSASDADTFEELYAAVRRLQGAEDSVVNLIFALIGAAAKGALKGYGKYRKGTELDSLDDVAKEPVIRNMPELRKAAEEAKKARKQAREIKKEPGKWSSERGVLKSAKTKDGQHEIKVTESGRVVVCSAVCEDAARRYAGQLEADAKAGGTAKTDLARIDKDLEDAVARRDDVAVERHLNELVDLEERLRNQRRRALEPSGRKPHEAEAGLHLEDLLGREVDVLDKATKQRLDIKKEGDFIDLRSGRAYDAMTGKGAYLNTAEQWTKFEGALEWHLYYKQNVDITFVDLFDLSPAQAKRVKGIVKALAKTHGTPRAPVVWFPSQ